MTQTHNQTNSSIYSEVDFSSTGRQTGFLRLPHSVHRSAYGWIPIPVVSLKNGDGPCVLLMAGNHGDEYEGQVALCKLARELHIEQVQGQIILLPMANFPAAKAGLRTSPLDDGNLNRSFPGDATGTPTQMIAHYIESVLLPRCDYLFDIHSGGSSLLYLPSLLMGRATTEAVNEKNLALLKSIGFPQALIYDYDKLACYSSSAALRNDAVAITAEVAGGGTIDPQALELLENGIYGYLKHIGCFSGNTEPPVNSTQLMEIGSEEYYCYSITTGLYEPQVELGDEVQHGQLAALVHDPETPWNPPAKVNFSHHGTIVCKRVPARVERGDCLFHLATASA